MEPTKLEFERLDVAVRGLASVARSGSSSTKSLALSLAGVESHKPGDPRRCGAKVKKANRAKNKKAKASRRRNR